MKRFATRRTAIALLALGLIVYPLVVSRFWSVTIGAHALILGIIALSLIFLAGYGGMISLAQTALAGMAAYAVAILTVPRLPQQILAIPDEPQWPAFLAVAAALLIATAMGALFGLIGVRSQGIYLLMLTAALGMGFFFFAEANYDFLGGHGGIPEVLSPIGYTSQNPVLFYYISLASAGALYLGVRYLVRTPFGLALQGIRDNPRRMRALGYSVGLHRVAAFAIAGFMAGVGGVLTVWYNGSISPGTVDLTRVIELLVIAVVGGLIFPEGAFVGALAFVLVDTFASSVPAIGGFSFRERFNTLIGLTFLLVVVFSPNGLIGIGQDLAARLRRRRNAPPREPLTESLSSAGRDPASAHADPASEP